MSYAVKDLFTGCPEPFVNLQKALCETSDGHKYAAANDFCVRADAVGRHYVDGLEHVARQWRLANHFEKIAFEASCGISSVQGPRYAGFIKVTWIVAAFEQYCGIRSGKKWHELKDEICGPYDVKKSQELAKSISESAAKKIKYSLSNKLKERWDKFLDGDRTEAPAVAVSLRHAFAHGEVWGAAELEPHLFDLASFLSEAISKDASLKATLF